MKHTAFISIGSNIGDRLKNCKDAIETLANDKWIAVVKTSSFYETEPWGEIKQAWFINCVIEIKTALDIKSFWIFIQDIENRLGRKRGQKGGPRIIDLDILFFDKDIKKTEDLVIPHQFLHQRRFVLTALNDIASDFIHPVLKMSIADLLHKVDDNMVVICITSPIKPKSWKENFNEK